MAAGKPTVLLAEDNPGDVFLVRRALDTHGVVCDLELAGDGEQAIRMLAQAATGARAFDLLMLDLNLPRRDGSEVLAALRLYDTLQGMPVLMLTSSDSPSDYARCVGLGATRYFRKPSDLSAFMGLGQIAKELLNQGKA